MGVWERTVVIVSKDENLTKSHVRYLESRLIKMAQDARRANLTNDTAPGRPPCPSLTSPTWSSSSIRCR